MGNKTTAAPDKAALLTTNAELQAKLNKLNELAQHDQISEFVDIFVPLDLSSDDLEHYKGQLMSDSDMWNNLKWEINTLATGVGVRGIGGNQIDEAIFTFDLREPDGNAQIDREVVFTCMDGEWRAEG